MSVLLVGIPPWGFWMSEKGADWVPMVIGYPCQRASNTFATAGAPSIYISMSEEQVGSSHPYDSG